MLGRAAGRDGDAGAGQGRAVLIRDEGAGDRDAVRALVEAAFGRPDEAALVDELRRDGDAAVALLAEAGGRIVGHVVLSPMRAPVRALALGPVSVLPARQGQGIGSSLIREALGRAREARWQAVFVLGEPGYYGRFGFAAGPAARFASPFAGPYFLALELERGALGGRGGAVAHAPAFERFA